MPHSLAQNCGAEGASLRGEDVAASHHPTNTTETSHSAACDRWSNFAGWDGRPRYGVSPIVAKKSEMTTSVVVSPHEATVILPAAVPDHVHVLNAG